MLRIIHMMNPYDAERMKKQGVTLDNITIVKHFFIPTDRDLMKLTEMIKDCKEIVDIGSGYGLLINELAKQNPEAQFLGIDTMYWTKDFLLPKAEKNVRFEFNGIEAMTFKKSDEEIRRFDCVICCWMPEGSEWSEMLSRLAKKKVILILSRFYATGTTETYAGMKKYGFLPKKNWVSGNSIIYIWVRH